MNPNTLHQILKTVQKPSQYLGNEVNAVHKDFKKNKIRVCVIFADAYEMGMSHMGTKILYEILNGIDGVVAERCFSPLPDMESELRNRGEKIFSLESKTPLDEFDVIGISLPYELTYTNALNIIDLAGIPLLQKDRKDHHPIILTGGTQSYNPEPMADFLDAVAIGDGEELIVDVVAKLMDWKEKHGVDLMSQNQASGSRADLLNEFSNIEGVYVPSLFEPTYNDDGTIKSVDAKKEDYTSVKKRIVKDLDAQPYPTKLVVPNIRLIHDRIGIEIQRGCTRMCRFCQAGYIERPTRQRSPEKVLDIAEASLNETGIEEISLLSLSAGDYQTIVPTMKEMNKRYKKRNINISVPATRTETLTPEMINEVKQVRMGGFTIAPEAGSERMRRVINKGNKVEDLMQACENAFSAGYRLIKFYYMCGLPFENDDDVINIAHESYKAWQIGRHHTRNAQINVSVSSFVPKPFTPFQWEPQMSIEETKRKHHLVKSNLKVRALNFKCHEPEMSYLEGLFARGDRKLSKVLLRAFEKGCRFDEWKEHLQWDKWLETFEELGVDLDFYLHRRRDKDEVLPWDHLFSQMQKKWLWREYEKANEEAYSADCSVDKCQQFCGACDFKQIKNRTYVIDENELAAKKGNREWYGRFGEGKELNTSVDVVEKIPTEDSEKSHKLRITFSKTGLAALMGHLELMGSLKRAFLRNSVPVAYSGGFHPQVKMSMGFALPLGVESTCEQFDLTLTHPIEVDDFIKKMNISLPEGLTIQLAEWIDLKGTSIYSATKQIDYQIHFDDQMSQEWDELQKNLSEFSEGKEFVFKKVSRKARKKTREILLNRYILAQSTQAENKQLNVSVKCDDQGSLRPHDIVTTLSPLTNDKLARLRVKKVGVVFQN